MNSPTVSVLVPCFNAERYVGMALESVLAQTWVPLEMIVVDDGSTDSSAEMLEKYRRRGVTVIHQANAGAAAARNRALSEAQGSHLLWLDADDWIGPDHVARLAARASERGDAISFSQWGRFFDDPRVTRPVIRPSQTDLSGVEWLVHEWEDVMPMMQSGMFLIPRTLVTARGGWNESLSLIDDFEFFARVISVAPAVLFARDALLCYRSGIAGSVSGHTSRKAAESACHALLLGADHLLEQENSLRTRRVCARLLRNFEYEYYPEHADLRSKMRGRIAELGNAELAPSGPPGFHRLRRWVGWKAARRVQQFAARMGLNRAARKLPAED